MPYHSVLADPNGHNVLGLLVAAAVVVVILAFLALFVAALVSILRSPLSMGMKVVWVVLAFVAPFLGSLLWFAIGRGEARRTVRPAARP